MQRPQSHDAKSYDSRQTGARLRPTSTWYQWHVDASSAAAKGKAEDAKEAARRAADSRPARVFARAGLIASGALHVLIGIIAIGVVYGLDHNADQSGALEAVADTPGGVIALWIAALSLFGLAIWQWTGPIAPRPEGVVPNKWRDRAKSVVFVVIGLAAVVFATGGQPDAAEQTRTVSSTLINIPGGIFLLGAIGVAVASVGVFYAVRGVSRRFMEDITLPDGAVGVAVLWLGIVGHTAKGIALVLVGVLFVGGAFVSDSSWTTGLDGAVHYLLSLPTGVWPLSIIALGFIAHGLYLFLRTRYMRR
nr:DUF1206 domain-containing protein [Cryobacterium sp. BB736]